MANIAIFRINYKSDFILTLNSDAGWLTPFCIKFWTGAPSQAYFVGFDGTTYTHCAPIAGEPTKLLVQFDDHHLPIGDLKFQIGYHFTVADFPTSVEDEVLNQASVIIEVNDAPAQVMLDLNGETAPEIEFNLPAFANEAQRIENEQQRIENEQQRIDNEQQRIGNEQTRQRNEETRIENEQERVREFGQMKGDLEQATRDAAAAAENANEKGIYAKNQGDYAKQQGDYAKQQGDTAQADHERAEEDHRIAGEDHTQAGSDHTRAGEDHIQAGSDHTRAGEDHTRAGDDHTRADQDHTRAESDHAAVEVYIDSLGAFDISAYHATGGVMAKYADLTAALGTNGANVPDALRKGGMSVKFVQSSDNKYVQYRCTAQSFTTNTEDWYNDYVSVSKTTLMVGDKPLGKFDTNVIEVNLLGSNYTHNIPVNLAKGRKYIISIPDAWTHETIGAANIFGVSYYIGEAAIAIYSIPPSLDTMLVGKHYINVPNIDVDKYTVYFRGDYGQQARVVISDITDNGGKNIILGNGCLKGYFVKYDTKFDLTANDSQCVSPFIKLQKDCIYTFSGFTGMGASPAFAKFDINKNFVETFRLIPNGSHTTSEKWIYKATDDCYIMCSFHINDINSAYIGGVFDTSFQIIEMNNEKKSLYNKQNITRCMFNYNNNGAYIKKMNGTFGITNKIWVKKGDILYVSGVTTTVGSRVKNAKFSSDGTFIDFLDYKTSSYYYISDFDGYLLFSIGYLDWNSFNIIKICGQNYIDDYLENETDKTILDIVTDNRTGRFDFTKVGVYDYYAAFDELAGTYRDFVKQENIGTSSTPTGDWATKDSSTYPINRYTLKQYGTNPTKRIVLVGATHGDSQNTQDGVVYNNPDDGWYNNGGDSPQNILSIYFFIADFLKNPTKNELYRNLYDNYEIEIIPIINPWGVQNHSRGNGRGVDLARNFDWQWVAGTSYGLSTGTSAFSENESAAFRDFYNTLSGVELCIEVHARGGILVSKNDTWLTVIQDTWLNALVTGIVNTMCSEYIGFTFGSFTAVNPNTPNLSNWVYKVKGVDSFVTEACQSYNSDIHTRNTKMINYWMTSMLGGFVSWWAAYKNNKVLLINT